MWADNETSEDLLGFKVHADLLIDIVNDDSVLPITIGVFGDWGSGKSSILQMLKEDFDNKDKKNSLCIYFNGWTFEGYDDAKAALLQSILKELEDNKKLSEEVKSVVKEKSKKLWKSIDWMRGAGMLLKNIALPAVSAYFTGGTSLIPYTVQKMSEWSDDPNQIIEKLQSEEGQKLFQSFILENKEDNHSKVNAVAEFRRDFSELINATKFEKLIVIVDDLDRCTPERIIENLEAIKLFLNVSKTAFVIGADPRIVKHAIEYKYKNNKEIEEENNRIVTDYLEKLIQLPYSLPRLSDSEVETYISMLVCKKELKEEEFSKVLMGFQEFRERNKYSAYGLGNLKEVLEDRDFDLVKSNIITIPTLVPLITSSLYGNPRQIKRFLNTYTIRKRLAKVASIQNFEDSILAKLMILEYSEAKLFKQIFTWQSQQEGLPSEITELEQLCKDKGLEEIQMQISDSSFKEWNRPKVLKWLQVEPLLSDVDLRDYFWISRDKLNDSISASSLIPPIVKSLFEEIKLDEMPAKVTKGILQDKFLTLSSIEQEMFLDMVSKSLTRNPSQKRNYVLFHELIDLQVDDAIYYYCESLKLVNDQDIDPSIGMRLKSLKYHPKIGDFLINYFDNKKSKAARAFNLK